MDIKLLKLKQIKSVDNYCVISKKIDVSKDKIISKTDKDYLKFELEKNNFAVLNSHNFLYSFIEPRDKKVKNQQKEIIRKRASEIVQILNKNNIKEFTLIDNIKDLDFLNSFIEGFILGNYSFSKYKTNPEDKKNGVQFLNIATDTYSDIDFKLINIICNNVIYARDLVNEPFSFLTAYKLSEIISEKAKKSSLKIEVFNKSKIETLRMGGLLAVNKGSIDPPSFIQIEWKPSDSINKKPIILVGKGIVYDTGGLSLKPTPNSMEFMKCDMAGAASVAGLMQIFSESNLPYNVIALIPVTDNRPSGNAYAPGDVITMHNGTTVEVLNTDAEGRLILGDALSYAKKFKPEIVIDFATLTGAASNAIGPYGIAAMGNISKDVMELLKNSGESTYERIVEFPLWDEYGELIKSDIADIKNLGGSTSGAITAGKFLEHFTDYPWIHLDIAPTAFNTTPITYHGKGGTGTAIRLVVDFIQDYCKSKL